MQRREEERREAVCDGHGKRSGRRVERRDHLADRTGRGEVNRWRRVAGARGEPSAQGGEIHDGFVLLRAGGSFDPAARSQQLEQPEVVLHGMLEGVFAAWGLVDCNCQRFKERVAQR